jgi:pimeloyl-ACP methyl ester carboxylesterase
MTILFLLSTLVLIAACLILVSIRWKWQRVEKIEFDTSAYDEDPVRISGLLLLPRIRDSRRLPGLVFCPGLSANKEVYLGLCRRVVNLGVAVLAIDLRGHGHSGGPSSFGKSEQHDVWAAIDVLGTREDIDSERLGVIGHSLGGIAATRAGFEQPFDRIKTVVAIYCWKGFGDAVEAVFGPLEGFVGRWWPYFGWSRQFSIADPHVVKERSVIERVGAEARVDYLLVVGSRDPLTDMERSKEIIARAAGRSNIQPGVTYGQSRDRLYRRIEIVKGANHFSVLSRRRTFTAIRQWLEASLGLEEEVGVPTSFTSRLLHLTRSAAVISQALSTLCLAGLLMGVLGSEHGPRQITFPSLSISILAAAAFLLASVLAIRVARTLRLKPFTPHWGADIVSLIAVSRVILFVPLLVLVVGWSRRGHGLAIEALGLSPLQVWAGLVTACALFFWMVFSWNIVARTNRFSALWPVVSLRDFSLLFSLLLVSYLAEESLFRGMIQSVLAGTGPVLEVLLSAFLYSVIASAAMTAAVWPLFPSVSYAATFRSRSIVLLPVVFVFGLAVFSVHGLAAALLYHFTGTIVTPALFLALTVSFLFTGPIGIRTY